jgi:hypothetical protein
MFASKPISKYCILGYGIIMLIIIFPMHLQAQDTSNSIFNLNQLKIVKKVNAILDSTQKKIKGEILNKANVVKQAANDKLNKTVEKLVPQEEERPLPYEILLNKKYTLGRRAYQNTVSQYNYLFHAEEELKEIIQNARSQYEEDYSNLLSFYDYDLANISKSSIDSIIYRCNANIVLHDLRSNWVDDAYLLLAKSYLYHKNFDTAGSILQFINYSFDNQEDGVDLPFGSNLRNSNGKFSIATKENNRIWENANVRNESMIWQARNYLESNQINDGISLLELLKADGNFPKRLQPFLHEQFAYGYYLMELYDKAATNLIEAIPNAIDANAKSRWYFLIGQLYQKANNINKAYYWYKKASINSPNPIIGVYAIINLVQIQANNANSDWQVLAKNLERITKREKYKPFKDIIYFEMAKIAIQYNQIQKANEWLITSVNYNLTNQQQKQKSFELLGEINYNNDRFGLAKMAYDSITNVIKTNPQFEQITLRKKWLSTIEIEMNAYQKEDSLQYIYSLPVELQKEYAEKWNKNIIAKSNSLTTIFNDKISVLNNLNYLSTTTSNNNVNILNKNSGADFYFENNATITQGKQNFIQKWGERPNVDMWRRKTSTAIVNKLSKQLTQNVYTDTSFKKIENIKSEADTNSIKLIESNAEYKASEIKWNNAALTVAQTFLLKLNDFNKAKEIYNKIIQKNIDPVTTERALLDLASQYLHDGKKSSSDSIINIVTNQYPNGSYIKKKQAQVNENNNNKEVENRYKDAYFLSQIGDWVELEKILPNTNAILRNTKWSTPFEFVKVKMYAQQKQDDKAIVILDSIILKNRNDLIRDKAKNILFDIKNRKDTERYLSNLQIGKDNIIIENSIDTLSSNTSIPIISEVNASYNENSLYKKDTTELHYIAIVANKINAFTTDKLKDSVTNIITLDNIKPKIGATISQIDNEVYVIWVGPFQNTSISLKFLMSMDASIKKNMTNLLNEKQYEIFTIGKSNIIQIKTLNDFKKYKIFMINNILK